MKRPNLQPQLHGKDDVIMSISVMYKHLVYPHLVWWMSQNGVSPLGWKIDVCMSHRKVILT